MKFPRYLGIVLFFLFAISITAPACSQKSGCPANESLKPKTNRKGEIKTSKKSQSGLFPGKMKKKM